MIARHADDEQEMLRAVGSFLERCGHIKAMWALEKSSGVATFLHGRDVAFVRELLMDGAFDEVQHFLKALQGSINAKDYNEAVFVVRRQQFLELLSGEAKSTPAVDDLVQALKPLEPLCSPQSFHQLCFCLTLPALTDHPDLRDWTAHGGRLDCFKRLLPHLSAHFPGQISRQPPPQQLRLASGGDSEDGSNNQERNTVQLLPLPPSPRQMLPMLHEDDHENETNRTAESHLNAPGSPGLQAPIFSAAAPLPPSFPASPVAPTSVVYGTNEPAASPTALSAVSLSPPRQAEIRVRSSMTPTRKAASFPRLSQPITVITPGCPVRTASFRPDGKYFAVGTNDRSLSICCIEDGFFNDEYAPSERQNLVQCVQRCPNYHLGSVYCVEWNQDGSLVATSGNDKRVRIAQFHENDMPGRDGERLTPGLLLEGHNGTIRDLAFGVGHSSGRLITAGAGDCIVRVWNFQDPSRRDPEFLLSGHTDAVWSVTVDATGQNALTASQDGIVSIWDLRSGALSTNLRRAERACFAEIWPSSPFHVAATYNDGVVALWDVRSSAHPVSTLYRHEKECRSIESVASPSHLCATASFDGTVAVHTIDNSVGNFAFKDSYTLPHPGRAVRARWHPVEHALLACTDSSVVMWVPPGSVPPATESISAMRSLPCN